MKTVLQRVEAAEVAVAGSIVGKIEKGYLLLVGFEKGDDSRVLQPTIDKILQIKLFSDENGRFAHSVRDISGSILLVSQFTLFADLKKGKKPSLSKALEPSAAEALYCEMVKGFRETGVPVQSGVFGAYMQVSLRNDGPVTLILDSKELFPSLY